jgi:tetraacyldisaccharide 4'-kinase
MKRSIFSLKKTSAALETFIIKNIEEHKSPALCHVLYGMSLLFKAGATLRGYIYDKGWKKSKKASIPIICIGNITAGGTGKTPFVYRLACDLKSSMKLAIISKGYRSLGVTHQDVITPIDKSFREVDSTYCGDEPFLLKKRLPEVEVLLSKNRGLAIQVAKKRGVEAVILDDGFQMKSLIKDLVVVMLAAKDLFGKGFYLPRGYLRDSPKRLQEADLICITQNPLQPLSFKPLVEEIRRYSTAPIIGAYMQPTGIKGQLSLECSQVKGKKVGVFCGIGRPVSYLETLRYLEVDIVETLLMPDHCLPSESQFTHFSHSCKTKGAEILLCTEKDFVKIVNPHYDLLPICYVETYLDIVYGQEDYEVFKEKILRIVHHR